MNSETYFQTSASTELSAMHPIEFDLARDLCEHLAVRLEDRYSFFLEAAVDDLINNGRAVLRAMDAHHGIERVVQK